MSQPRFRRVRKAFMRPTVERLEERTVPTVNLFIDFGEGYAAGGLTMTLGELQGDFAKGGVQGPDLINPFFGYTSTTKVKLTPLQTDIVNKIDYNGDGAMDLADFTDLRDDVVSLVQRYYEPFNVNVQVATNSTLTAIRTQLSANNSNPVASGIADSYVLCSRMNKVAGGLSVGEDQGLFGIAGVDTNWGARTGTVLNDLDNCDMVFADVIMNAAATPSELATRLAYTVAHEAGHSFGIYHLDSGFYGVDYEQLVGSEILVGGAPSAGPQRINLDFFSRFPLPEQTGFTVDDVENPYEILANHALSNIGAKSDPSLVGPNLPNPGPVGPSYVTGTGAHDIITITQASANTATVTIEPHSGADFTGLIDIPGVAGTSYTYTVNLDGGLLIDAGIGGDRIVVDARLGKVVTVRGMGGDDQLVIDGHGTASAAYTPNTAVQSTLDGLDDRRGSVVVGSTTVNFQEFELAGAVTLKDVLAVTFQSPGGADLLDLITVGGSVTVQGTINGGLDFVPFALEGVGSFVLDVSANEGTGADDVVTLKSALTAAGLTSVVVNTGAGNDRFVIEQPDLALPVAGGGFTFNGGEGADRVEVTASALTLAANESFVFNGEAGDDVMALGGGALTVPTGASLTFDGADGDDRLELGAFSIAGGFTFAGAAGSDTIASAGTASHTWAVGNNAVTLDSKLTFQTIENVQGGDGVDQFVFRAGSRFNGKLDGGAGEDVINLAALSSVRVNLSQAGATDGLTVSFAAAVSGVVRNINRVVAGAGGGDSLQGLSQPAQWSLATTGTTYSVGGAQLTLVGFDALRGGGAGDQATVSAGSIPRAFFDAAGGADSLRVAGTEGADRIVLGGGSVTVNGRVLSFASVESIDAAGGGGNDTFTSLSASLPFARVELRGEGGSDTFNLTPAARTIFRVFGDQHSSGPGDTLKLRRGGAAFAVPKPAVNARAGRFLFAGRGFIEFAGIEKITGNRSQFLPD